jgi:D-alanyl-D-alanine dipeptidase
MSVELLRPIPDYSAARTTRSGYRNIPIDSTDPRFSERLVPIADYGVGGTSYYSLPNKTTGDPVPGVNPNIYVRASIARKLAAVNEVLRTSDAIARIAGERIELNVRDGYRSPDLQTYLHSTAIPQMIRNQYPSWNDAQVVERRNMVIAAPPSVSEASPPPHATGGVFDTSYQYEGTDEQVTTVYGKPEFGTDAIFPDFLEELTEGEAMCMGLTKQEFWRARNIRRVTHNLMKSEEVGAMALVVNPVELWHFSRGDQLWAQLTGAESAYYGYAIDPQASLTMDPVAPTPLS